MKALEFTHLVHGQRSAHQAAGEDMYDGGIVGDVVNMANAESAVFYIVQLAGVTGTATVQIFAADDATPTTTAAISFYYRNVTAGNTPGAVTEAKTLVTTAAADQVYEIEVPAAKLAEVTAFAAQYIQFSALEKVNDAVDGLVLGPILHGLRSAEDNIGTQLT